MNLSKQQEAIVTTTADKVVVIASAASGKTAVLTERVRYLLERGVDPKKIVLITFTNAAAEELAQYQAFYLGDTSKKVIYLTFDCGYENGNTARILDTLRQKNVKAAFFWAYNPLA